VLTRRPDETRVTGHNRDGAKLGPFELTGREARMVAQLAQILVMLPDAIQREKRAAQDSPRGGGDPPDPIRLEIVDYRQDLLHRNGELADLIRAGRRLLGLSDQVRKLHGFRCDECDCVGLVLNEDEWEVWCTACDVRWPVDGTQIAAMLEQQRQEAM